MEPRIIWLGHASFKIESENKRIYIDPWKTKNQPKADLILLTHSHPDHLSEEDVASLKKNGTVIMGPKDVGEKLPGTDVIRVGEKKEVGGIKVEAYPAYNLNKEFHPRANGWLGLVVDIGGFRIYHSGDTDVIEEMSAIDNIDVALLPVGGTYTMDPEEATQAVKKLSPKKAIPMHWGDIVGGKEDALKFKELADCEVEILEPGS
ncbi:MAG: MBL fold metallo-hydrolase [Candidatus Thermoplasmatota archaeon]|nr:MBL fold metallo-hydrolase [Candidatus Thermoplasmatota archaeon]